MNAARKTSRQVPKAPRRAPHQVKFSTESKIGEAIWKVREDASREQLGFMPPGLAARLRKLEPGLYKYGWGPKRGEVLQRYKNATIGGAMTSLRIGSRAAGEFHWLIDNHDGYPVVIRIIDASGKSAYRVEEYANMERPALVAVQLARQAVSRKTMRPNSLWDRGYRDAR